MNILGKPSAPRDRVLTNLSRTLTGEGGLRFNGEMFPELWDAALFHGIDPVVMVAQSYKETGGGAFTGLVKPEMCNPCGLKLHSSQQRLVPGVTDGERTLAHAIFPNWTAGAIAHAQHLRAYSGAYLPDDALILSPRYPLVKAANKPVASVEGLSTRWAPSRTYGSEIVAIAAKLSAA